MKRCIFILLAMVPLLALGESKELRAIHPSELRIGYGDPFFEMSAFYAGMHRDYTCLSPTATYTENRNYKYTGHVMAEYQYRLNSCIGVGGQVDFSEFFWETQYYHGGSDEPFDVQQQNCYNVVVMPTVRFTYLHNYVWGLYSQLGVGMVLNGGTEEDSQGRHLAYGYAADVSLFGVSVGANHFFGALEIGGMVGLKNLQTIYLLSARILTVSMGVRF